MLMPSIFGENLFDDDWMNFPFNDEFWGKKNPLYGKHAQPQMKSVLQGGMGNAPSSKRRGLVRVSASECRKSPAMLDFFVVLWYNRSGDERC